MSEWHQPITAELFEVLKGARTQATVAGNQQYVVLCDCYLSTLHGMMAPLSRWVPDGPMTESFSRAAANLGELYRKGNIDGVLRQSYAIMYALPGNPDSLPPVVIPPPRRDD